MHDFRQTLLVVLPWPSDLMSGLQSDLIWLIRVNAEGRKLHQGLEFLLLLCCPLLNYSGRFSQPRLFDLDRWFVYLHLMEQAIATVSDASLYLVGHYAFKRVT